MRLADTTRRRLLKGAVAAPAGALGGCIATPYAPYYRPSSSHPNATFKGAWCSGAAGPKSIIGLPLELHLGAQRIEVPPIRFDRRTFDGGIEPFNR